jgi:hypothetical protein
MALQLFVGAWPLFQFRNLTQSVGLLGWGISPSQGENKHTHKSRLRVGFEPTTPVFSRARTVHALDRAATVIGIYNIVTCQTVVGQRAEARWLLRSVAVNIHGSVA